MYLKHECWSIRYLPSWFILNWNFLYEMTRFSESLSYIYLMSHICCHVFVTRLYYYYYENI